MSRASVEDERDRSGRVCLAFAVHEVERGEEDARGLGYLRRVDEYRADGRRIVEFDAIDGDAVSGGVLACLRQLLALGGCRRDGSGVAGILGVLGVRVAHICRSLDVSATIRRPGRPSWILAMVCRVIGAPIRRRHPTRRYLPAHLRRPSHRCRPVLLRAAWCSRCRGPCGSRMPWWRPPVSRPSCFQGRRR